MKKVADDVPVVLKVAPDLTDNDIAEIAKVALKVKPAALIISNTTIDRDGLKSSPYKWEEGGLSGRPLMQKSTALLQEFIDLLKEINAHRCRRVSDAADALAKLNQGRRSFNFIRHLSIKPGTD